MSLQQAFLIQLIKKNPFIFGLLGAVLIAFLFPHLGAREGPLKAGLLTKLGVMVIFFLQGLSLKTRELASGMRDLRIHGFVQAWIFLVSPLILVPAGLILKAFGQPGLAAGFFFLALIPTTISSAVAFSSAARGNVAAAIFNTTLSNVLGVFWVPTGCVLLFATGSGTGGSLIGPLLLKLSWLILLPLLAGQLLRPFLNNLAWFNRVRPAFKSVNHGIILFIVFSAFSESVLNDTWGAVPTGSVVFLLLLTGLAVLLVHAGVWISSGWFLKRHEDRVTALFCGSQKTLAAGAPMAVAIFANGDQLAHLNLSLILLPLLCYHPIQLFLAAFLLPRLGKVS
jgi:sodium/bile acid cotransporter 7